MNSAKLGIGLIAFTLLLSGWGCRRIEETDVKHVSGKRLLLVHSSNLDGEIDPCG